MERSVYKVTGRKPLWEYRVKREGQLQYMSLEMTQEEISYRDRKIREILKETRYEGLETDELMNIRVHEVFETDDFKNSGVWIEDGNGAELFLPSKGIGEKHSEFLKQYARIPFDYMGRMGKDFNWSLYGEQGSKDISTARVLVNRFTVNFEEFRKKGLGIYIYSKTKGSGKTLLACTLLNEITSRYAVSVKFITIKDYLDMTKDSYDGKREEMDSISNANLLVIDDIGMSLRKDWINTTFYNLINERNNKRLVTIYTSNVEVGNLNMDDRVIDRIDSRSYPLHLPEVPIRHMEGEAEKEQFLKSLSGQTQF